MLASKGLLGNDLVEKGISLANLLVELGVVVQVALNLLDGEIDEHTCDLGSLGITDESLDVLVDELTDHLLEVLILRDDSGKELEASHIVAIDNWVRVSKSLSLRSDHDLGGGLSNERSRLNLLGREVLSATRLGRAVTSDHGLLSGTRRSVVVGESVGSLVLEIVVVVAVAAHLSLNKEEDLLNELHGVRTLEDLRVKGTSILLSHVHEVSLVLGVSLLLLADLW